MIDTFCTVSNFPLYIIVQYNWHSVFSWNRDRFLRAWYKYNFCLWTLALWWSRYWLQQCQIAFILSTVHVIMLKTSYLDSCPVTTFLPTLPRIFLIFHVCIHHPLGFCSLFTGHGCPGFSRFDRWNQPWLGTIAWGHVNKNITEFRSDEKHHS